MQRDPTGYARPGAGHFPLRRGLRGLGEPRPHYRAALEALQAHDLTALGEQLRARTLEREVRYGATGPDEFVIDAVPRMFTAQEWDRLDRGLDQRVRALDAFLRDAYGERRIIEAGIVPARLVEEGQFTSSTCRAWMSRSGPCSWP